jgi:hypothetical protein
MPDLKSGGEPMIFGTMTFQLYDDKRNIISLVYTYLYMLSCLVRKDRMYATSINNQHHHLSFVYTENIFLFLALEKRKGKYNHR